MKKIICLLSALTVTLLLASCNVPQSSETINLSKSDISSPDISGEAVNIEFINGDYGTYATQSGCYMFLTDGIGGNLTYTDFKTKQRVNLCERPECTHSDETCTSYLTALSSTFIFGNRDNSQIYIIHEGGYFEPDAENKYAKLMVMEPNGSNRRELLRLPGNEAFCYGIAKDESNIYIIVNILNESGVAKKELRKINMQTGDMSTVCDVDGQNVQLRGAYENYIIISDMTASDLKYYSVNLQTNIKEQTAYSWNYSQGSRSEFLSGSTVYSLRETDFPNADIYACNLLTGEEKLLAQGLQPCKADYSRIAAIYDNRLLIHTVDNSNPENIIGINYAINLENNELTKPGLSFRFYHDINTVDIVAESEEYFMVYIGNETYQQVFTDNAGVPYTSEGSKPVYALITKQDYWNSNEAYIQIEG